MNTDQIVSSVPIPRDAVVVMHEPSNAMTTIMVPSGTEAAIDLRQIREERNDRANKRRPRLFFPDGRPMQ